MNDQAKIKYSQAYQHLDFSDCISIDFNDNLKSLIEKFFTNLPAGTKIHQVKMKFKLLRIYADHNDEKQNEIVQQAIFDTESRSRTFFI